jgi:hypothetical protein
MATFSKALLSLAVALVICFVGAFMISGCNAGGGSSGGTEEYKVIQLRLSDDVEKTLNEEAKQGWKLRAVQGGTLYMAR